VEKRETVQKKKEHRRTLKGRRTQTGRAAPAQTEKVTGTSCTPGGLEILFIKKLPIRR